MFLPSSFRFEPPGREQNGSAALQIAAILVPCDRSYQGPRRKSRESYCQQGAGLASLPSTFCSEQSPGNRVTQSHGTKAATAGMSAEPPEASFRQVWLFVPPQTPMRGRGRYARKKTSPRMPQIQDIAAAMGALSGRNQETSGRQGGTERVRFGAGGTDHHDRHWVRRVFFLHQAETARGGVGHDPGGCSHPSVEDGERKGSVPRKSSSGERGAGAREGRRGVQN